MQFLIYVVKALLKDFYMECFKSLFKLFKGRSGWLIVATPKLASKLFNTWEIVSHSSMLQKVIRCSGSISCCTFNLLVFAFWTAIKLNCLLNSVNFLVSSSHFLIFLVRHWVLVSILMVMVDCGGKKRTF